MCKFLTVPVVLLICAGCAVTGPPAAAVPAAEPPVAEVQAPEETAAPDAAEVSSEPEAIPYLDFTAYRPDGEAVKLSDYIGTPLVVNFWATWCPPCRAEMALFAQTEADTDGVAFLMVNLTDGMSETQETVEAYLADEGLVFDNVLLDSDSDAAQTYGVYSIPATLFINADGNIIHASIGQITEAALQRSVQALLEESAVD